MFVGVICLLFVHCSQQRAHKSPLNNNYNHHLSCWDHNHHHNSNNNRNTRNHKQQVEVELHTYDHTLQANPRILSITHAASPQVKIDKNDMDDVLQNLPSITSSCVVLSNLVDYHSEVEIAIHSYLLANGFPVCYLDLLNHTYLGYRNWFQPPSTTSLDLAPLLPTMEMYHAFDDMRFGKRQNIKRPTIMVTITPSQIFPLSDSKAPHRGPLIHKHPNAIVIVHEPALELETRRLRFEDAESSNWTLAFLSPRLEQTWMSGSLTESSNRNQIKGKLYRQITTDDFTRQSAHPQTTSFVPVWQNPTTIPGAPFSPFIHTSSPLESQPEHINWTMTLDSLTDTSKPWKTHTKHILSNKIPANMDEIKTWKYIVVQGTMTRQRRDYRTLFQWMSKSRTLLLSNSTNTKIILVGRLPKAFDFRTQLPLDMLQFHPYLLNNVLLFPSLTHIQFSNILEHSRGVYTALYVNDWSYVDFKCSGAVPTALSQAIPILGDSRMGMAYGQPVVKGIVEFRNPDIRATNRHDSPMPLPPMKPLSSGVSAVMLARRNVYEKDTPGVLRTFDTFEKSVRWLLTMDNQKFLLLRRQLLSVRESLFQKNVRKFRDLIHATQVA